MAQTNVADSAASRVIAIVVNTRLADVDSVKDSTVYTYTGSHGGEVGQPGNFTSQIVYKQMGKAIFKNSHPNATVQTFNAKDNVDTIFDEHWDYFKTQYFKGSRKIIGYDALGNDTAEIAQQWDSTSKGYQWQNTYRSVFTSGNNHHQQTENTYYWNPATQYWIPGLVITNSYDTNKNLTSSLFYSDAGGRFDTSDNLQYLYEYNNNNMIVKETDLKYNLTNKVFDSIERTTHSYNSKNKEVVKVVEEWSPGYNKWINGVRYAYFYNANNNIATIKTASVDTSDHSNDKVETFTYNAFNQPTTDIEKQYDKRHVLIADIEKKYTYENYMAYRKR